VTENSIITNIQKYPTPYSDVNLRAMQTLREKFQVPVGYSDHTKGIEVPIAAVACGASVIDSDSVGNFSLLPIANSIFLIAFTISINSSGSKLAL